MTCTHVPLKLENICCSLNSYFWSGRNDKVLHGATKDIFGAFPLLAFKISLDMQNKKENCQKIIFTRILKQTNVFKLESSWCRESILSSSQFTQNENAVIMYLLACCIIKAIMQNYSTDSIKIQKMFINTKIIHK